MIEETDLEIQVIRAPSHDMSPYNVTGVYIKHLPTGIYVFVCTQKSQLQNKALALKGLEVMLNG